MFLTINLLSEHFDGATSQTIINAIEPLCASGPLFYALANEKQHYYDHCKVIEQKTGGIFGIGQSSLYYIEDKEGNVKPVDTFLIECSGYFNYSGEEGRLKMRDRMKKCELIALNTLLDNKKDYLNKLNQITPLSDLPTSIQDCVKKVIAKTEKNKNDMYIDRYRRFEYVKTKLIERASIRFTIEYILTNTQLNYPVDVISVVDRLTAIPHTFYEGVFAKCHAN